MAGAYGGRRCGGARVAGASSWRRLGGGREAGASSGGRRGSGGGCSCLLFRCISLGPSARSSARSIMLFREDRAK